MFQQRRRGTGPCQSSVCSPLFPPMLFFLCLRLPWDPLPCEKSHRSTTLAREQRARVVSRTPQSHNERSTAPFPRLDHCFPAQQSAQRVDCSARMECDTHRNSDVLKPKLRQVTTWFINWPQPSLRTETLSTKLTSFMKRFQPPVITSFATHVASSSASFLGRSNPMKVGLLWTMATPAKCFFHHTGWDWMFVQVMLKPCWLPHLRHG